MCLCYINHEKTRRVRKTKKILRVYKVIKEDNASPIFPYLWHIGLNISTRESVQITKTEKHQDSIYKGFHVLLSRKSAERYCQSGEVIMVCYADTKDLVAYGEDESEDDLQSAVFTKLTVKRLPK